MLFALITHRPWSWRHNVPPKRRLTFNCHLTQRSYIQKDKTLYHQHICDYSVLSSVIHKISFIYGYGFKCITFNKQSALECSCIVLHVYWFTELPINSPGDRDAISLGQFTSDGSSSICAVAITLRTVQRLKRDAHTGDGGSDFGNCLGIHSTSESHEMDCLYSPFRWRDL
jgi:hypothetical protein